MRTLTWIAFGLSAAFSAGCTTVTTESTPDPVSREPFARTFAGTAAPSTVASGPDGDLFLGGSFYGTVDFGGGLLTAEPNGSLFMAHLDAQGSHLFSGATASQDQMRSTAIGPEGDLYVAGGYDGFINFGEGTITGTHAGFLAGFVKEGASQFQKSFEGQAQVVVDRVQTTKNGDVIIAARADDSTNFGKGAPASQQGVAQGVVVAFDRDAHELWEVRLDGAQSSELSMTLDAQGNALVAGLSYNEVSMGGFHIGAGTFMGKIDASGKPLWLRAVTDINSNVPSIHDMATDGDGNVYFGGLYYGDFSYGSVTLPFTQTQNAYFIKASPAGDAIFGKAIVSTDYVQNMELAVSDKGEIVVALTSYGTVDFGKGGIGTGQSYDGFLGRYSAAGENMKAMVLDGTSTEYLNDLVLDADGRPVIVGSFDSLIDIGKTRLIAESGLSVFVARLDF